MEYSLVDFELTYREFKQIDRGTRDYPIIYVNNTLECGEEDSSHFELLLEYLGIEDTGEYNDCNFEELDERVDSCIYLSVISVKGKPYITVYNDSQLSKDLDRIYNVSQELDMEVIVGNTSNLDDCKVSKVIFNDNTLCSFTKLK